MGLSDIVRKAEKLTNKIGTRRKLKAGWLPTAVGYIGYGDVDKARVIARVLMEPKEPARTGAERGFRQFFTTQVAGQRVTIHAGAQTIQAVSDSEGYIDTLVYGHELEPGWHEVRIDVEGGNPGTAQINVLSPDTKVALISDIDDTVMVTMLPRALIAAYNSWFLRTDARKPVPGMASFYKSLGDIPVFYLSTGAWNTFPALVEFMEKFGFPKGPMLLTDWGPTPTGLFRNGVAHKKVQLRNLLIDFPDIQWILVGDDGQHDPLTYGNISVEHPARIKGVAIRELTPSEHVLAHGTAAPIEPAKGTGVAAVPWITGADGHELQRQVEDGAF